MTRRIWTVTCVLATLAAAGAAAPTAQAAGSTYCSPSGDLCYGAQGKSPSFRLKITLMAKYFNRYTLCVRAPNGKRACERFRIVRSGRVYGSTVAWAKHFPFAGAGRYRATWKWGSGPAEPAITFTVRSVAACADSQLRVTHGRGDAATSHRFWPIVFHNDGAKPCTLRGYPGVSSTNAPDGPQIADPAVRDPSQPVTRVLLLARGGVASAVFTQTVPEVFDPSVCPPTTAAGLRVYAPGGVRAFYLALSHPLCASGDSGSSIRAVASGAHGGV